MRRAAPSPRPDVPGVRRGQARVRGRRGDRGGLQLCGAPPPAGARQAAPAGDRAGPAHRGCPHGGRTARRQAGAGAHRPAGPGRLPPGGQRSDLAGLAGGAAMTIEAGLTLPELVIEVTPTFVISTAIATRDFQDVHHDRDRAVERGGKDIFVNILTTTGLVQRYVTDWAGPQAVVRKVAIRLGAPCYAGDTLTFSGRVVEGADRERAGRAGGENGEGAGAEHGEGAGGENGEGVGGRLSRDTGEEYVVEVVGRCSLGDHVTGTVRIAAPGSAA